MAAENPLENVRGMESALNSAPILSMFSTGKDSIVMTDLLMKYYSGEKTFVYFYLVPDLEFKETILQWYENKYGVKINRFPNANIRSLLLKKKIKQADGDAALRKKFDISWMAYGYKKNDSMARRGMLANLQYGIDDRQKKLYPVGEWSDKQIYAHIKLNKLALPVEYSHGFDCDFYSPTGAGLLWLKRTFPNDYRKIVEVFPEYEAMAFREESFGNS